MRRHAVRSRGRRRARARARAARRRRRRRSSSRAPRRPSRPTCAPSATTRRRRGARQGARGAAEAPVLSSVAGSQLHAGVRRYNIAMAHADRTAIDAAGERRALAALDELPEATVVLRPVRDDAGARRRLRLRLRQPRARATSRGVPSVELLGRRVLEALPAFPRALFDEPRRVLDDGEPLRTQLDYGDGFAGGDEFSGRFEVAASRLGDGAARRLRRHRRARRARSDRAALRRRPRGDVGLGLDRRSRPATSSTSTPAGRRMVGIGLDEDITRAARSASSRRAWARERVRGEALAVARARRRLARRPRAPAPRRPRDPRLAGDRRAHRRRRRGRLLRHDRARHDARARRRGRAARERGALPRRLRAGADRHRAARPRRPLRAGQRRVLPHGAAHARGAACGAARSTITHPDDVARLRARDPAAGRRASSTEYSFEKRYVDAATARRSGPSSAAACCATTTGAPQYLIGHGAGHRRAAPRAHAAAQHADDAAARGRRRRARRALPARQPRRPRSAATGTTSSRCPTGASASSSATSSGAASRRP